MFITRPCCKTKTKVVHLCLKFCTQAKHKLSLEKIFMYIVLSTMVEENINATLMQGRN